MTPIGPLAPPPCRLCGGAKEVILSIDPLDDDLKTCPRCGGSGEEPPVPAAVLEAAGQQVLFTLAPLVLVIIMLVVGIGLIDSALFIAIAVCELIDRRRQRREQEKERAEKEARRERAIRAYYRVQVESPRARESASWR